jgi:hypothetical protein
MNLFKKHKTFENSLKKQIGEVEMKPSVSLWDRIDAEMEHDAFEAGIQTRVNTFEQTPYAETWHNIEAGLPKAAKPWYAPYFSFTTSVAFVMVMVWWFNAEQQQDYLPKTQQQTHITEKTASTKVSSKKGTQKKVALYKPQKSANQSSVFSSLSNIKNMGVEPKRPKSPSFKERTKNTKFTLPISTELPIKAAQYDAIPTATEFSANNKIEIPISVLENISTLPVSAKDSVMMPTSKINVDKPPTNREQTTALQKPLEVPLLVINDSNNNLQQKELINNYKNPDDVGNFSISIIGGVLLSYSTYQTPATSTFDFSQNIEFRKQVERPAVDWAGGFLLDYRLNDRWMISSGIMMLNFYQRFDYSVTNASTPGQVNELGAVLSNPSDSIIAGGSFASRIKYSWNEIPLFISYKISQSRRWTIFMQGGVSYGILSAVDGAMVSYDNKGVLILKDENSFPQIKNAAFISAMPQAAYSFGQNVSFGVVPTIKYSVNSIIGNEKWVQQHPYFVGLNLCLRKRF